MLEVKVRKNNVEHALRILKRKVKDSGLMLELKKRSYYEKPSEIKRYTKNMQKLRYKYKQENGMSLFKQKNLCL